MENIDEDFNIVFIPSSLNPMEGDIIIVKWDRLRKLDVNEISIMKIYRKLGLDFNKILKCKLNESIFNLK